MSAKKSGGLTHNPLLSRTDPPPAASELAESDTRPHADTPTRIQVDTPTRENVDTSTRTQADTPLGPSKFTFYFTAEQLDRLDRVWETMRNRNRGTKQRVSKSQFVRVALNRLLDDFDKNPEQVIALLQE